MLNTLIVNDKLHSLPIAPDVPIGPGGPGSPGLPGVPALPCCPISLLYELYSDNKYFSFYLVDPYLQFFQQFQVVLVYRWGL